MIFFLSPVRKHSWFSLTHPCISAVATVVKQLKCIHKTLCSGKSILNSTCPGHQNRVFIEIECQLPDRDVAPTLFLSVLILPSCLQASIPFWSLFSSFMLFQQPHSSSPTVGQHPPLPPWKPTPDGLMTDLWVRTSKADLPLWDHWRRKWVGG